MRRRNRKKRTDSKHRNRLWSLHGAQPALRSDRRLLAYPSSFRQGVPSAERRMRAIRGQTLWRFWRREEATKAVTAKNEEGQHVL